MGLLQAAAAAEMDACLVRWAMEKLDVSREDAGKLLLIFRSKRESGQIPSMTLNIDGDRMTPDEIKQAAGDMLSMAFHTEMEAFLVQLLVKDVGHSAEVANQMIQEFRKMMGLRTVWPSGDRG